MRSGNVEVQSKSPALLRVENLTEDEPESLPDVESIDLDALLQHLQGYFERKTNPKILV